MIMPHRSYLLCLLIAAVLALLTAPGCEPRDDTSINTGEPRIAALSPAVAVILRDLELDDRIVARHAWDLILDRSLPVAGDQTGIDYEALIRARPTHIILEWGARPLPARLEQLAQRHGWSIHRANMLTLADIQQTAQDLHQRFGGEVPWHETTLAHRLNSALAPRDALKDAGRILLLASVRPPAALGPGSAHHQLLEALGGTPALDRGGPFITLDAEDVLRTAPDGIIMIIPRPPASPPAEPPPTFDELQPQLGRLASLDIPAVRHRRIAIIDHPLGQLPSTALLEVGDEIAHILAAWAHDEPAADRPHRRD